MMFFNDWTSVWRTALVGVLAYAAMILWLRISGKRTLSRWNAFDAIVTFALGSMLANVTLSSSTALLQGVVAFGLFVGLQLAVTWLSVRWARFRRVIKGHPTLLVRDGEFLPDMLVRERVTQSEVLAAVREKGLASLDQVHAVVLETSGTFSVIAHPVASERSALADVEGFRR